MPDLATRVDPASDVHVANRAARLTVVCVLAALLAAGCARTPQPDSLTILLPDDILSLDPNQDVESFTDAVLFNVFEPLVGLDSNLNPHMLLAESWEHPQPERWRFHLRKGVRFHDGSALEAGIVRDGLVAVQRSTHLDASDFLSQVVEIAVVDPLTLDVVTREPRTILANLPILYVAKQNAHGAFPPLVGTGPYRLREWTPKKRVVLERSEDYWGGRATFRSAAFEPVPDAAARLARLIAGSADMVYEVPPELTDSGTPGVRFLRRQGLTLSYMGFSLRPTPGNPFADPRVRRAIHLAIDREALVDRVLRGAGSVATQPVPPMVFGFNPSIPRPVRDVDKARALLSAAGHARGLTSRLDFGQARLAEARILRDQVAAAGVTLELHAMERQALYEEAKAGRSTLYLAGWNFSSGEASEFYEYCLHTPSSRFGFNNYGGYSRAAVDEIAERNGAVLDQRERRRLLQSAATLVMEDLPVLPLYAEDDIYGVRGALSFEPRADGEIRLFDVKRTP